QPLPSAFSSFFSDFYFLTSDFCFLCPPFPFSVSPVPPLVLLFSVSYLCALCAPISVTSVLPSLFSSLLFSSPNSANLSVLRAGVYPDPVGALSFSFRLSTLNFQLCPSLHPSHLRILNRLPSPSEVSLCPS